MAEPQTPPAEADTSDRGVALLLAVAAVCAALITLVAVNSSNDASTAWQSALRQEVARGVQAVEDIRYTYEVDMPGAFQIASLEVQAQEYRAAASSAAPEVRPQLEAHAQVLEMTIDSLRAEYRDGGARIRAAGRRLRHTQAYVGAPRRPDPQGV